MRKILMALVLAVVAFTATAKEGTATIDWKRITLMVEKEFLLNNRR